MAQYDICVWFVATSASILLGRLPTGFRDVFMGIIYGLHFLGHHDVGGGVALSPL